MTRAMRRLTRPVRHWVRYTPPEQLWFVVMCVGGALVAIAIVAAFVLL